MGRYSLPPKKYHIGVVGQEFMPGNVAEVHLSKPKWWMPNVISQKVENYHKIWHIPVVFD